MVAYAKSNVRPVDGALERLTALAARAVPPNRMAREVEILMAEWSRELQDDGGEMAGRTADLIERLDAGVVDAEEQLADVDREQEAALKQAEATLAALSACRDAARGAVPAPA